MAVSLPLPRLVMFDLDGTLVDTAPDLAAAVDQTLMRLGRSPVGEQRVRGWLGKGFALLLRRALSDGSCRPAGQDGSPDQDMEDVYRQAVELFPDIYMRNLHDRSHLYPGVHNCLRNLRKRRIPMACVTNKNARFSEKLLCAMGVSDYFSVIVSGDSLVKKKPEPEPLWWTMRHVGVSPPEALMVGDSDNDVQAARAAGSFMVGVSYGYCQVGMHALRPDAIVDSLATLTDLFM